MHLSVWLVRYETAAAESWRCCCGQQPSELCALRALRYGLGLVFVAVLNFSEAGREVRPSRRVGRRSVPGSRPPGRSKLKRKILAEFERLIGTSSAQTLGTKTSRGDGSHRLSGALPYMQLPFSEAEALLKIEKATEHLHLETAPCCQAPLLLQIICEVL